MLPLKRRYADTWLVVVKVVAVDDDDGKPADAQERQQLPRDKFLQD